ncbi:protein translocase subunit secG [Granulicatella balaenopterae]|uniref:Protein-export membrane protein SecG n=1 Tax=Granulicatella balaenopterae TaxID=137733 RepID=A0A1H9HP72_9LACT|nr:preprotein translocase subunit SecG [Granulicatella balaenopterae]SEQ64134.1 protein translocase subunit secG [Granulicatella balaenopterae]
MYSAILAIMLVLCVLLIIVVAMQPSKTNAASSLTGGAEQLFGKQKARGFEAFLVRVTVILGALFMILATALVFLQA